jgi:hypothetical protein
MQKFGKEKKKLKLYTNFSFSHSETKGAGKRSSQGEMFNFLFANISRELRNEAASRRARRMRIIVSPERKLEQFLSLIAINNKLFPATLSVFLSSPLHFLLGGHRSDVCFS